MFIVFVDYRGNIYDSRGDGDDGSVRWWCRSPLTPGNQRPTDGRLVMDTNALHQDKKMKAGRKGRCLMIFYDLITDARIQ